MTPIRTDETLADLVIARPELAARLDGLGLDYCCGGQRTVMAAIGEAGLDLAATITVLEAEPVSTARPEWEGIGGLIDHLQDTHHVYLRSALPRLVALADKVAGVHHENHPELRVVSALVSDLEHDLTPHLVIEEEEVFPLIRQYAKGASTRSSADALRRRIADLEREHDAVGDLLARLRTATDVYRVPDDGCASYQALYAGLAELESDTHLHVHKENNLLFPGVLEAGTAR